MGLCVGGKSYVGLCVGGKSSVGLCVGVKVLWACVWE